MGIPIYMEDLEPAVKNIMDKLDSIEKVNNQILQYSSNFDEEVFASLKRIEDKFNQPEVPKPVSKPISKKR